MLRLSKTKRKLGRKRVLFTWVHKNPEKGQCFSNRAINSWQRREMTKSEAHINVRFYDIKLKKGKSKLLDGEICWIHRDNSMVTIKAV